MKLNKPYTDEEYADLAVYCNTSGASIIDQGDYLETVPQPEPTEEELLAQKAQEVRALRDSYLQETDKFMLCDYPVTEEQREAYVEYRQYLRNIPETEEFPNIEVKTFENWKNSLDNSEKEEQTEEVKDDFSNL